MIRFVQALILAALISACAAPPVPSASPTPRDPTPPIAHRQITQTAPAQPTPSPTPDDGVTIGESVQGRPIRLYRLGSGSLKLILVGGMHGGYEWNTILLAYQVIDAVRVNPRLISGATVLIVPDANPDGVYAVSGREGRFSADAIHGDTAIGRVNAHGVDLNRNWDCRWRRAGQWNGQTVSGGTEPFSEPETRALRDLILSERPDAVVFWHSALGAVMGGGCGSRSAFDRSKALARAYAVAARLGGAGAPGRSGYGGYTGYAITGDASDWVSAQGIPAITVELATHDQTELESNLAGIRALITWLSP